MDAQLNATWRSFLDIASTLVPSSHEFNMWFKPITPISFKDNVLTLRLPSQYYYERIENDYLDVLREGLGRSFGTQISLDYQILTDSTHAIYSNGHSRKDQSTPSITTPTTQQRGFKSNLDPRMSLETFYQSICNRTAHAAAVSIIEKPGETSFNPLFVHGASGVGKTHILHAIGNEIQKRDPKTRIVYVPAQIFKLQYVEAAIRRKNPEKFIHFYQNIDVLLIDDIQELADAVSTQNAFFQIFNNLKQLGRQIVIASDRPPVELKGLEDRLYTRLKWGLTTEIERPDPGLRKQILEAKMYENDIELPQDVFKFIVKHADKNVRDIEGTLTSIMAHAVFQQHPIDLEITKKVMAQTIGIEDKSITPEEILKVVCAYYNVDRNMVLGRSRKRDVTLARQLSMYLIKEYTSEALKAIGRRIGDRDHSTVIYSCKAISNLLDTDLRMQKEMEDIKELLNL